MGAPSPKSHPQALSWLQHSKCHVPSDPGKGCAAGTREPRASEQPLPQRMDVVTCPECSVRPCSSALLPTPCPCLPAPHTDRRSLPAPCCL